MSKTYLKIDATNQFLRLNSPDGRYLAIEEGDYTPTVYGYLYNHYAAVDSSLIYADGWGVHSESFLGTLRTYIGNDASFGVLLKSCRTVNNPTIDCSTSVHPRWDDPTTAFPPSTFAVVGINTYNFNSIPGGVRYDGTAGSSFSDLGKAVGYWLFDTVGSQAKAFEFSFNSPAAVFTNTFSRGNGFSIRLARFATSAEQTNLNDGDYADDYVGNDGRKYKTVKIGTQIWLAENLAETKYRDGTPIPLVSNQAAWDALSSGARCIYDNDSQYL